MAETFFDSGHPVFRATSALDRGFLRKRGGRCTIHFSAEPSNAEMSFRTVHPANQLSIYGAVASCCDELTQLILGQSILCMEKSVAKVNDQLCKKLELQEVDTLVLTPRTNVQAAGDRLRTHRERFEELSNEIKILQACESAGFMRKVSIGQYFKTMHDVDDGFGGTTGTCREYTLPRVIIKIPNLLHGLLDAPGSVQFFKSKSHVVLTNTESKYRHRQHQQTDLTPG